MNESVTDTEVVPSQGSDAEIREDLAESGQAAFADLESSPEGSIGSGDFSEEPHGGERSATIYWMLLAVLFLFFNIFRAFPFDDDPARHVIWEFISTTLALIVASLSLVRYYSKKQRTFLFIGTGFLGTGLLNGYHAVMTSTLLGPAAGAPEPGRGRVDLDGREAFLVVVSFRERVSLVERR